MSRVAIIGAGVAGATVAMRLAQLGVDVTLYERESSIISGPPFCHLHAGGNLYREISDQQCISLLRQSIDFIRYYPFCIDYRPTVIAVPLTDSSTAESLLPRLELLRDEYTKLVAKNNANKLLKEPKEYFRVYTRAQMEAFRDMPIPQMPNSSDEWMIPVAHHLDLDQVQYPLILVQEYGLNMFRLAAGAALYLESLENVHIRRNTKVIDIKKEGDSWQVRSTYKENKELSSYDYLINSAGFRSGEIDDMLNLKCPRMVEFKAAYVTQCDSGGTIWPEVIFHGERGTPRGMAQFTPYPDGYFQLHGMTTEITLFENGLASSSSQYAQPKLNSNFVAKIEQGWNSETIEERTKSAIDHLARFIPHFSKAKVASKPLYGAQQIPGDDPSLRVAEVTFALPNYARCEIVKVSSTLDMADAVIEDIKIKTESNISEQKNYEHLKYLEEEDISNRAKMLCQIREYPKSLASRCMKQN